MEYGHTILALAVMWLGIACGPATAGDGDSSGTASSESGSTCNIAALGCACSVGGACDAGLECSAGVCVPSTSDSTGAGTTAVPDSTGPASSTSGAESDTGSSTTTDETSSESSTGGEVVYSAVGPQVNVPVADVHGWEICWSGPYNGVGPLVSDVLTTCDGDDLMLACRHPMNDFYGVLAHAPRADVLMEQPWPFVPHEANGSGWYFWAPGGIKETGAWGFVAAGDLTAGGVCDFDNGGENNAEQRLCWHTRETFMYEGFRCGASWPLNDSMLWERVVLHR